MIHSMTKATMRAGVAAMLVTGLSACSGGLFGGSTERTTPTVGDRTPILSRIESGAEVDPALASVSVVLPPAQVNSEWAQGGGTASKNQGHVALAAQPSQVWTASVAGSSNRRRLGASPVVGAGRLYVVDTSGNVSAFDARTGASVWSRNSALASNLQDVAFGGGVSYFDGHLYGTNGAGEVLAMDAATGNELWKVRPAGPLRGSPTIAFGSVFVMTQDNQIFALDARNGELQWQESASATQAGVFGVAAPAAGQGTVIAGYSSGELVAYRYENGRTLWADALARTSISTSVGSLTDIDADPIIDNGRVYALGQGGRMAAYELVTGQRIWELNLSGISTPAISGEWVFTLTNDARLLAIARSTGKVRWLTQLPAFRDVERRRNPIYWQGPVLAGGNLWTVNSEGQIYRIGAGSGEAALVQELRQPVTLPPIVADNTLFVIDDSGRITAFR